MKRRESEEREEREKIRERPAWFDVDVSSGYSDVGTESKDKEGSSIHCGGDFSPFYLYCVCYNPKQLIHPFVTI